VRHSKHTPKIRKPSLNPHQQQQQARKPAEATRAKFFLPRWAVIGLCVVLAFGATLAVCEFFIFAKLPPELVGKWVVLGGQQDGATFDFSRRGTLEAHLNDNGMMKGMIATVAVEDKTMRVTTQKPGTERYDTTTCVIRELTGEFLVVEFPNNEVFRMARAK
jgi:hypothetical protein